MTKNRLYRVAHQAYMHAGQYAYAHRQRRKSMQSRIRDAEKMKIPYIVIIGDKEVETETISIRTRKTKDQGLMKIQEFIDTLKEEIRTKGHPTN